MAIARAKICLTIQSQYYTFKCMFKAKISLGLVGAWLLCGSTVAWGQFNMGIDIEKAPFLYSASPDDNPVSRLRDQLTSGDVALEYSPERGNLQSLLAALDVPESSQVLVFSKTSMQVRHISSRNPRAIYFNDDTYVAWIYGSSLVEISTADPHLGTAFYTVDMAPKRSKLQRAFYDCMACHATALTQGVPGHTVRSVFPMIDGSVDAKRESFITDDSSPLAERWGGWYVTGTHGDMTHMGNTFLRGTQLDTRTNGNRQVLRDEFNTQHYLTPFSDIVALMVLEHQTQMHNSMTRADFFVRQLQYETKDLEVTDDSQREWREQLRMIAKEVVDRLLFCKEAKLTSPVQGSNAFSDEFAARGPRDSQGRSLREFDLTSRMFRYPCSYMIYSTSFTALQPSLRNEIYAQLQQVLTGQSQAEEYQHLDEQTRQDTLTILRQTLADFPASPPAG